MEMDSGGRWDEGMIPEAGLRFDDASGPLEHDMGMPMHHGAMLKHAGGLGQPPSMAPEAIKAGAYSCSICLDLMLDPVVGE
jgi:hypothetical protein